MPVLKALVQSSPAGGDSPLLTAAGMRLATASGCAAFGVLQDVCGFGTCEVGVLAMAEKDGLLC